MTSLPVPGDGTNQTGPYLVVINSPETLPSDDLNLYRCDIPPVANVAQRFRVFVWHQNKDTAATKTFSLAGKLSAGTATVSSFNTQVETPNVNDPADWVPKSDCCAYATLYGHFQNVVSPAPGLTTTEGALPANLIVSPVRTAQP